jgi:uncharacterized protein
MALSYETDLYRRIHTELVELPLIDTHEHLQRESELPSGDDIHIGRLFTHYASCDLISGGMPPGDMNLVKTDSTLAPRDRWKLLEPWYRRAWNTAYCESLRIAIRDLYGVEEFSDSTVDTLTDVMRSRVKHGFTREVFDAAGIEYAMQNPFGPRLAFNPDFGFDCFICDMIDGFTTLDIQTLSVQENVNIYNLDEYVAAIELCFNRYARYAGSLKVGRAYDRTLVWQDVPKCDVEGTFNRLFAHQDLPDRRDLQALEDYIMHQLCRLAGEYGLRIKFHTGLQEGNGNNITNSRAAHLINLFLKYPKTNFDIYHISYPYDDELTVIAKNFANVTVDYCWAWVMTPAATRKALSVMLDAVPANKLHGFGGDYVFVEGSYGHSVIARREIARVLAEKVEEGRFNEEYAVDVGRMLLRENAIESFDLDTRRERFREVAGEGRADVLFGDA